MNWNFEDERMYSLDNQGVLMAELLYKHKNEAEVVINKIYVNPSLRGQGIAGKMMVAFAQYLREKEIKTTATCSYAKSWLEKNNEAYSDIIA